MQDELKACGHCGDVARNKRLMTSFVVECGGCGISTAFYPTKKQAITAWNTRADPALAAAQAEVARLSAALKPFAAVANTVEHYEPGRSVSVNVDRCRDARAALVQP